MRTGNGTRAANASIVAPVASVEPLSTITSSQLPEKRRPATASRQPPSWAARLRVQMMSEMSKPSSAGNAACLSSPGTERERD